MAASALNEERELAVNPIVSTSVQHNNQVRHRLHNTMTDLATPSLLPWLSNTAPRSMLTFATGHLQHPQSDSFTLRGRRWNAWPRVIPRLHLLPGRHTAGIHITIRAQNGWQTRRILLSASGRHVVGRRVRRLEWLRAYLDALLWIGPRMRRQSDERRKARSRR